MSKKLLLEAILNVHQELSDKRKKEIAEKLELPQNNQKDLMFMSAILVSTGVNKNGAGFLGSELVLARESITQKPVNISHESKDVIGHITSWIFMDQVGNVLDDKELYAKATHSDEKERKEAIAELDKMEMDIGIICAVYRANFPEISEEIEMGKWKVSMECYYDDFDVQVDDVILSKNEAAVYDKADSTINREVRDVAKGKCLGNERIARMLRGVRFCGVAIVGNPANNRSLILEAASQVRTAKNLPEAAKMSLILVDLDKLEKDSINEVKNRKEFKVAERKDTGFVLIVGSEIKHHYSTYEEAKIRSVEMASDGIVVRLAELNCSFLRAEELAESEVSDTVIHTDSESYEIVGSSKVSFIVEAEKKSEGDDELEAVLEAGSDKVDQKAVEQIESLFKIVDKSDETEFKEEKEFPVGKAVEKIDKLKVPRVKGTTTKERKKLSHTSFGLRQERKYPIHSKDRIHANMKLFQYISKTLEEKDQKEFFNNLVIAGIKLGISTETFEESVEDLEFAAEIDYSAKYGLPRLEMFPLDTREQVISAMSKFSRLKVKMSSYEREMLVVNILKAAATFGINTNSFKQRALKTKAVKKQATKK